MAKKSIKRRKQQKQDTHGASSIGSSSSGASELPIQPPVTCGSKEQKKPPRSPEIDATCEIGDNEHDSELLIIPSAFTPSIVQQQQQNQEDQPDVEQRHQHQSASIQLLRNIWSTLEAKKKQTWVPTPIQLSAWPLLCPTNSTTSARKKTSTTATTTNSTDFNMIGIAPTGSGKTLAYGIPMLMMSTMLDTTVKNASKNNNKGGVCGVVLAPTRELASQIERELTILVTCLASSATLKQQQVKVVAVYGGVDRQDQMDWLCSSKKKSMLVTATPGRLVDLIREKRVQKALSNDTVRMVVLDEADRLATCSDMAQQVDEILKVILASASPCTTSTVATTRVCLYSATYPRSAKSKWNEWVSKPRICIKVSTTGTLATATSEKIDDDDDERNKRKRGGGSMELARIPDHVTQNLEYCATDDEKTKRVIMALTTIRKGETDAKARRKGLCIIFFNRIKTLQSMSKSLVKHHGMKCAEFHGKQHQKMREQTLADFKSGKIPTLLATDVAARGIHVNNVEYIINHDFPETLDQVRTCAYH
jgi:superfamily II DNA/RNA helicase